MAAFGILAALHERERSGEGQLIDVAMTRGAQSWLALVAARYFADGAVPGRGELELAGGLACYRPYACADGWVTLGALEPKFWQSLCRGLERDDLLERQMDPSVAAELEAIFATRTRADWAAFDDAHGCCLEPVLELDEALARSPEAVVEVDQPGATAPVRLLGPPIALSRTPPDGTRAGPALGADTDAVLAALGYTPEEVERLKAAGAVAGPDGIPEGSFLA
jgi:alpha-methylacyl-CoA racemase